MSETFPLCRFKSRLHSRILNLQLSYGPKGGFRPPIRWNPWNGDFPRCRSTILGRLRLHRWLFEVTTNGVQHAICTSCLERTLLRSACTRARRELSRPTLNFVPTSTATKQGIKVVFSFERRITDWTTELMKFRKSSRSQQTPLWKSDHCTREHPIRVARLC